jgi:hypothetical protein
MRRRHVYVLLFALPTFLLALVAGGMLLGAAAGVLWLFVFGDDPWPSAADTVLTTTFVVATLAFWFAQLGIAYTVGRREERQHALNRTHVLASVGATIVLGVLIAVRLFGLGTAASRTDTMICADHCFARGFSGSGMPSRDSGDRTCSCFDAQGQESLRVPIEVIKESR